MFDGRSIYEYTLIIYVLIRKRSVSTISFSLVYKVLLVLLDEESTTYPLATDEVQLTLILVSFNKNTFTLFGGLAGAIKETQV